MVYSLSIHNSNNSKDVHVCTDNNNCHECWLAHSDSKAVDFKTHYDFTNVKYVKTQCLRINEVVLTSLFMANRIFPCVLTLCFLLNYFSSIILSDYKTCKKGFLQFCIFLFPHICGFLINQFPQTFPRAHKGLYPFLLLTNWWNAYMVKLYGKYLPRKKGGILDSHWQSSRHCEGLAEGRNKMGCSEGNQDSKWIAMRIFSTICLWDCVSTMAAYCIILRLVVLSLSLNDLCLIRNYEGPSSSENLRTVWKLDNELWMYQCVM